MRKHRVEPPEGGGAVEQRRMRRESARKARVCGSGFTTSPYPTGTPIAHDDRDSPRLTPLRGFDTVFRTEPRPPGARPAVCV